MSRIFITSIFTILSFVLLEAQTMRVERGDAIHKGKPVWNIFVDSNNGKWAGNADGVFQLLTINNSSKVKATSDDWHLLRYRNGNANIKLSKKELSKYLPRLEDVNCAHYDETTKHLWVGTTETGLYEFKLEPLSLVKNYTIDNSELNTNFINFIKIDDTGRMWIGTNEGVVWGKNKRWNLDEEYLNFVGMASQGAKTYIISDEWIWEVSAKGRWKEYRPKEEEQFKGAFVDAALDSKGRLWLASEIISRYDFESKEIEPFAAPEDYTSEFATSIAIDKEDALWVGTRDKGLFLIQKEDAMTVSIVIDKALTCDNTKKDAALSVVVEGGKPPYTYKWKDGLEGTNPSNLGVGIYKLTVSDTRGNAQTASVKINDPRIEVTIANEKPESAAGMADAVIRADIKGGQPDYTYKWDNGETTFQASKLTGGKHELTVTDAVGCSVVKTINVPQNIADLSVSIAITKTLECAEDKNGEVALTIEGGKLPYKIKWNDNIGDSEKLTGLGAGNYAATVTDASGKKGIVDITIVAPKPIIVNLDEVKNPLSGQTNGKASISAKGGQTPYRTYEWSNGETKQTATKLSMGQHQVTVTDAKGCQGVGTVTIGENVLPISVVVEVGGFLKCKDDNNGRATASVKGGKSPFTYKWSGGKAAEDKVTDLSEGSYEVVVTDAKGQEAKASFQIKAPEAMIVSINAEQAASAGAKDGQASVKVKGGKSPYQYKWDNGETDKKAKKLDGGNHSVTVTDANGCVATASITTKEDIDPIVVKLTVDKEIVCYGTNVGAISAKIEGGKPPLKLVWSNGQKGEQITNLKGGNYQITVTDATNAEKTAKIRLNQPEPLGIEITKTSVSEDGRSDGEAFAKGVGGIGEYTYQWSNGDTGRKARRLKEGNYSVTMTDTNGCTTDMGFQIKTKQIPQLRAGALRKGQTIKLNKLYFDADSSSITPQSLPTLDELRDFMVANPTVVIEIGGHTNNIPAHEFCDRLSTARAKSVADYLTSLGTVKSERVKYKGYGKRKPKYTNKTKEGREKNQRVEVKVLTL